MASSKLMVSVGDVVMVKAEDDVAANSAKTQVILQLQPISQGMCEDLDETGACVAEGTHEDGTTEEEVVEYGYPITCGDNKAILLFKKFVCPGINVNCVQYNDQLISPKQFVHLAGKATLKDWKRAIRLGGVMLRKMMDVGQIDFYQHDTVCANTCRSTKFDLLINNARFPPPSSVPPTRASPQGQTRQGNREEVGVTLERPEETPAHDSPEWSPIMAGAVVTATDTGEKKEAEVISEETLSFWKGIADVGLLGEVLSKIRTELLALLRGVRLRSRLTTLQEPDVAVLTSLAQVFELLDSVKRALETRRSQTDGSKEQGHNTLADLERQLEEQKKQGGDRWPCGMPLSVVSVGTSAGPLASKRPRLQRPASVSALDGSHVRAAPQFTVLSPIALASLGQTFSISSLAQVPGISQLFTHHAAAPTPTARLTLLSATAVSVPDQMGVAVSPVEMVHLTQEEKDSAGVREMVEGALLVEVEDDPEDENQAQATVIEIDPVTADPTAGEMLSTEVEVMGGSEKGGVVLQVDMMEEGAAGLVIRGEMEDFGGVQIEHDVEIVVIEEETIEE